MARTVLEIALELAALGLPVFPCGQKKKPAIAKKDGGHGFHDAVTDPDAVRALFARAERARLVAVPTGEVSGFDVLDFDYRAGAATWEQENAARLPLTRTHLTQSGGRHRLFRHAPGVRNLASTFAPGMDVRGEGGYVIFPPSHQYMVENDAPIAEWPDWLLKIILPAAPAPRTEPAPGPRPDISSKRLAGMADAIIARVRSAPEGGKHYALRNAALSMGGIATAAGLGDEHIVSMLLDALPSTVKDKKAAEETARWGVKQGRERPIELKDRPEYTNGAGQAPPPRANGHAETHEAPEPPRENGTGPRLPTITVMSGLRHEAADAGLKAMVQAKIEFYQRDKSMVRAATSKAKTSDGKVIEIPSIVSVAPPMLGRALGLSATWERVNADGELIRIDPPREVVDQIASMSGEWPFEPLTGVIATPTMRPDGTILDRPGYDRATGLLLVSTLAMPTIPNAPTRHEADAALDLLQSLLAEFPFADQSSRAVALSMILTVVLRGALLPAVPTHAATAPQPGTGKSYLADIASAIGTGERCAVIAMAPSADETEKRLIGAALSGQQIIALDNVSEMISGDFLNQVTERPILQLRGLGSSDMIRIANTFTVFANGNNLSAPADMVRRTLVCRLDANLENPEERHFESDPVAAVLADRGRYVAACLTIGRAYVVAGYPDQCRPLPSYERWSGLVRSALVWLGVPDPCLSMDLARAEDPLRGARAAVFNAWADELGANVNGLTTAELVSEAEAMDDHGFLHPRFRDACLSVAADRNGTSISSRRLAKWLSSSKDNRVKDLKLSVNLQDAARPRWRMTRG